MNQAMLSKLVWRLIKHPDELSSAILAWKYGGWQTLLRGVPYGNPSHIWRAIQTVFPLVREGVRWRVGNGRWVSFWLDRWLRDQPLLSLARQSIQSDMLGAMVVDVWCSTLGWSAAHLFELLPADVILELQAYPLSTEPASPDTPEWIFTGNLLLSTRSVRHRLQRPPHPQPSAIPWLKVWQFRGPVRASLTLWTCLHQALPTTALLWQRGIIESPICRSCRHPVQSTLHLLRDCQIARRV